MEFNQKTAQNLIENAMKQATETFKRPICVAICDKFGFLLAFTRMDGAPIRSIQISQGKAYTAARMGMNTDAFLERLHRDKISVSYFCDDKLTALPGGSILKDKQGNLVGAVGISGLTSQEDQVIANKVAEILLPF
jgi:glc operon protein GlcG